MDLGELERATFAAVLGTRFRIAGAGESELELELTQVEEFPVQPDSPRAEPFSLLFVGPPQPLLEQRIYRLEHPTLGELEIFLVPIGYEPDGRLRYEAVFN